MLSSILFIFLFLCVVPSREEVWAVVNEMHPLKAPGGLDGMSGSFFRSYWNIVGDQVFAFVKDFFSTRRIVKT